MTFAAAARTMINFSFAKIASLDGLPLTKKTMKLVVREASTLNCNVLGLRTLSVSGLGEYLREIGIALSASLPRHLRYEDKPLM